MPAWKWLEISLDFLLPTGLLFIGLLVVRSALKAYRFKPAPRCFKCGYDMRAGQSLTCPECGYAAPTNRVLQHGKVNKFRFGLGVLFTLPSVWVVAVLLLTWASTWSVAQPPRSTQPPSSPATTQTINHPDFNVRFETTSFAVQLPREQTRPPTPLPNKAFFWVHKIWDRATYKQLSVNYGYPFSLPGNGPASDEELVWRAHQDVWFGFTYEPQPPPSHFCCTGGPYRPPGFTTIGYLLSPYLNPINHYQRYFLSQEERITRLWVETEEVHRVHYAPPPDRVTITGRAKQDQSPATLHADVMKQIANKDSVTEMTLSDLALSDSAIKQLHNFNNLKSLTLVRVYLTPSQLKNLGALSTVQQLSIEQSSSQPNLDFTALESWKNLTSLSIDPGTREFWDLPDTDLARLLSLPKLTRLYLRTSKVRMNQITLSLAAAKKRKVTVGKQTTFVFTKKVNPDDAAELAQLTGMTVRVEPDERAE